MVNVFGIVMANTSIAPEYFLDKMTWYELNGIMDEIQEKNQRSWEQTRMLATHFVNCFAEKTIQPVELMPFSWDKLPEKKPVEKPDMSPDKIKKMETFINNFYGSKKIINSDRVNP